MIHWPLLLNWPYLGRLIVAGRFVSFFERFLASAEMIMAVRWSTARQQRRGSANLFWSTVNGRLSRQRLLIRRRYEPVLCRRRMKGQAEQSAFFAAPKLK